MKRHEDPVWLMRIGWGYDLDRAVNQLFESLPQGLPQEHQDHYERVFDKVSFRD